MIININILTVIVLLLIGYVEASYAHAARVLELSDRFLDVRKDGVWLVKFYAPWCGHCRKLEPIFNHVAQALHDTVVRVARVDCTRFPSVATEFQISGFPTIMFLRGSTKHVYRGDRTSEDIVQYAKRMTGPAVRENKEFRDVIDRHEFMFGYVGDREGIIWDSFNQTAIEYQPHCDFFSFTPTQVPMDFLKNREVPMIFVHKENQEFIFNSYSALTNEESNSTQILIDWVIRERFPTFVKVTRFNFQHLLATKKYLVMAVVEEDKLGKITPMMSEFKDMVESVIKQKRDKYHELFQFGWVGSPELANSVAMTTLAIPSLLVVNSTSFHHYMPELEPHQLTATAVVDFLEQLLNESAVAYGGNSFGVRMYRTYYEAKTNLIDMWAGNPILTTVLFGLPLGFLSLIFYSICCADIMDAPEDDDSPHEKKE